MHFMSAEATMTRLPRVLLMSAAIGTTGLLGTALADPASTKWERALSAASARLDVMVEPTADLAEYRDIVVRIDEAIAPSLAIYEDARDNATTPELRLMAAYGIALTHLDAMIRARNAALAPDIEYGQRHATIEPMLVDHRIAALDAFRDVRELAEQQPGTAAANPVVTFIVADAHRQLAALQPSGDTVPSISTR
jgi:hypothetical protein